MSRFFSLGTMGLLYPDGRPMQLYNCPSVNIFLAKKLTNVNSKTQKNSKNGNSFHFFILQILMLHLCKKFIVLNGSNGGNEPFTILSVSRLFLRL